MIELTVCGAQVRIHPLALLLPLLAAALGLGEGVLALLVSLLLHESGHLLAARLARVRVESLSATPFGCGLQLGNLYALSPGQTLAVSAGGPGMSLLVLLADGALAHWGLLSPAFAGTLARVTLALFLFNLLPALPLDGGRMLYALTSKRLGRARSARLAANLGYGVAACLCAIGVWQLIRVRQFNPTLPACALFMLKGISEDRQALSDALPTSLLDALKPARDPVPMRLVAVSADTAAMKALRHLTPDAATLFAVYRGQTLATFMDEREVLRLALHRPDAPIVSGMATIQPCVGNEENLRRDAIYCVE